MAEALTATVDDVISRYGLKKKDLDKKCTLTSGMLKIINKITDWKTTGTYLGIPKEKLASIEEENRTEEQRRIAVVQTWKEREGRRATYLKLAATLNLRGRNDLVEDICGMIASCTHQVPQHTPETKNFITLLKTIYQSEENQSDKWPPNLAHKVFNLALVKNREIRAGNIDDYVRMTITGKVDDILRIKCPIELKNLFEGIKSRRKLILLEGAPGSGKSTLSIHICQKWGKGELFQEFSLIILVQLRIPKIQQANCIADLLQPTCMTKQAKEIERELLTVNCRNVLFILDGWDELPPELREESLFRQLIQPNKKELSESAVIVTSRPIASYSIQPIITSRVEILGFKPEELEGYFTKYLEDDSEAAADLMNRIEAIPAIARSIHLPLNASILAHLYKHERKLPATQSDVFVRLICNYIFRSTSDKQILILTSLDDIPKSIHKAFEAICKLAYDRIEENKITFTLTDPSFTTLGLLQGFQTFTTSPKTTVYQSFVHLSVQEFLAAWHVAKQPSDADEQVQVSTFKRLFSDTRFNHMLQFYAAITGLRSTGYSEVIIQLAREYGQRNAKTEEKLQLLLTIRCLYEAQNQSLCELFISNLESRLNLSNITLHTSDCVCICYVLCHVSDKFTLQLNNCKIVDQGSHYLLQISKDAKIKESLLNINVCCNDIRTKGTMRICDLLRANYIHTLDLGDNHGISNEGIKSIANALECNKSLKRLYLFGCGVTAEGFKSIATSLLINSTLEILDISYNDLSMSKSESELEKLAETLKRSSLKVLRLSNCCMTDFEVHALADSLQSNTNLKILVFYNYHYRDSVMYPNIISVDEAYHLAECLHHNSILLTLTLPVDLRLEAGYIQEEINCSRREKGTQCIEVNVENGEAAIRSLFHVSEPNRARASFKYNDSDLRSRYTARNKQSMGAGQQEDKNDQSASNTQKAVCGYFHYLVFFLCLIILAIFGGIYFS